jgi:hypothetical protein
VKFLFTDREHCTRPSDVRIKLLSSLTGKNYVLMSSATNQTGPRATRTVATRYSYVFGQNILKRRSRKASDFP